MGKLTLETGEQEVGNEGITGSLESPVLVCLRAECQVTRDTARWCVLRHQGGRSRSPLRGLFPGSSTGRASPACGGKGSRVALGLGALAPRPRWSDGEGAMFTGAVCVLTPA